MNARALSAMMRMVGRLMGRSLGLGACSAVLVLALATGAVAAATPDGHDRALAHRLDSKVSTFSTIVAQTGENSLIKGELKSCAPFQSKDPSKAFAAAFALLPALLVRLVDDYKPQMVDLVQTVSAMHPDAPVFREWLTALGKTYALILKLDNHGRKVDLCEATTVFLDKKSTAADYQRALGVSPILIGLVLQDTAGTTVSKLDPKMRAFFISAGISAKHAKTLTS